eukprot:6463454-Amphidinium_carterae.1
MKDWAPHAPLGKTVNASSAQLWACPSIASPEQQYQQLECGPVATSLPRRYRSAACTGRLSQRGGQHTGRKVDSRRRTLLGVQQELVHEVAAAERGPLPRTQWCSEDRGQAAQREGMGAAARWHDGGAPMNHEARLQSAVLIGSTGVGDQQRVR